MDDVERNKRFEATLLRPWLICFVCFGFGVQPLLKFVDPTRFWFGVSVFGIGFATWYVDLWDTGKGKQYRWIGMATMVIAAIGLLIVVGEASNASSDNDRRCLELEKDMLSAKPLRANGPDVFQALGCRVQSPTIPPPQPGPPNR